MSYKIPNSKDFINSKIGVNVIVNVATLKKVLNRGVDRFSNPGGKQ